MSSVVSGGRFGKVFAGLLLVLAAMAIFASVKGQDVPAPGPDGGGQGGGGAGPPVPGPPNGGGGGGPPGPEQAGQGGGGSGGAGPPGPNGGDGAGGGGGGAGGPPTPGPNGGGGGDEKKPTLKARHLLFEEDTDLVTDGDKVKYQCVRYNDDGTQNTKGQGRQFCGCTVGEKRKPESFAFPKVELSCLANFYKVAMMPMCGNEWYDQMKLCAMTHFFNDKPPAVEGDIEKYKKALILIDGCATCASGPAKITKLRVTHHEKGGNLFSSCSDETKVAFELGNANIAVPEGGEVTANTASFTLPVMLGHRICSQIFGDMEQENEYNQLKLELEHDCGGGGSVSINLPDVKLEEEPFTKNRVGEMRGLWVDLDNGKVSSQYRPDLDSFTAGTPKYEPKEAPTKWDDPNLDCWMKGAENCDIILPQN